MPSEQAALALKRDHQIQRKVLAPVNAWLACIPAFRNLLQVESKPNRDINWHQGSPLHAVTSQIII
jgi:hypothetical protein